MGKLHKVFHDMPKEESKLAHNYKRFKRNKLIN